MASVVVVAVVAVVPVDVVDDDVVVANVASMLCILYSMPAFDILLIAFLQMLLIFLHACLAFNKNR